MNSLICMFLQQFGQTTAIMAYCFDYQLFIGEIEVTLIEDRWITSPKHPSDQISDPKIRFTVHDSSNAVVGFNICEDNDDDVLALLSMMKRRTPNMEYSSQLITCTCSRVFRHREPDGTILH